MIIIGISPIILVLILLAIFWRRVRRAIFALLLALAAIVAGVWLTVSIGEWTDSGVGACKPGVPCDPSQPAIK